MQAIIGLLLIMLAASASYGRAAKETRRPHHSLRWTGAPGGASLGALVERRERPPPRTHARSQPSTRPGRSSPRGDGNGQRALYDDDLHSSHVGYQRPGRSPWDNGHGLRAMDDDDYDSSLRDDGHLRSRNPWRCEASSPPRSPPRPRRVTFAPLPPTRSTRTNSWMSAAGDVT